MSAILLFQMLFSQMVLLVVDSKVTGQYIMELRSLTVWDGGRTRVITGWEEEEEEDDCSL